MSVTDFLADSIRTQARDNGDRTAIVFEGRKTDFATLDESASRIANGLIGMRAGRGRRIAILDKSSAHFFAIVFGAVKARAVPLPINFRMAPPEVLYVLDDAGAPVLFVGAEFYPLVEKIEDRLATVRTIIALDGGHPRWRSFSDWLAGQSPHDPGLERAGEDDLIQMYTSGTTGMPKGVYIDNDAWMAFAACLVGNGWARVDPGHVRLVPMPLYHVAGAYPAILSLQQGGTIVVTRDVDPAEILQLIPRYRVTTTLLVPAVIQMLLQIPAVETTDFSSLETIQYGASPIPEAVLVRAMATFGCGFVQVYGLTENMGAGTLLSAEDHDPAFGRLRSCGRCYAEGEARIVGPDDRELKPGEVGEIVFRSDWLMTGYWGRPEETAAALRDGWLHTGDAGYMDEDGYLFISDRIKDMIISGGENVYPAEVENALHHHPAIADVAVIGIPDERWGEAIKAVVVLKAGAETDEQELIRFARERIAGYKLPKSVDFTDSLPRNPSGKVLRRELRERYAADQEGDSI